jgi:hypothetical protein
MILSASRLILFSFHPEFYAIPHPEQAGTIMVTEDIPVGPLMMYNRLICRHNADCVYMDRHKKNPYL